MTKYRFFTNATYPHSTEIFRKYCKNIPWKYFRIAKIFWNLSLIVLKYCNNLVMSAQNMTYAIFSKIKFRLLDIHYENTNSIL